jgi:hypothetical protein
MATTEADISKEALLRVAFDAWKFQVDAYWTRSSYFVVFEIACAAGIWKVFDANHWLTSAAMSVGAIVLTRIWVLNNARLGEYIHYYWERLQYLEAALGLDEEDAVFMTLEKERPEKRYRGDYRQYVNAIPWIFYAGWFWMLIWTIVRMALYFNSMCHK